MYAKKEFYFITLLVLRVKQVLFIYLFIYYYHFFNIFFTIYFITKHYIALILLATLTIQFLFFKFFLYMCKKTTKYIHYRYTLQERKKKSLTENLFHLHPIERLILQRGVGLGGGNREVSEVPNNFDSAHS